MVSLTLFVHKTRRAKPCSPWRRIGTRARLMGINVNAIITLTFAIGSALAAVAGVFYLLGSPAVYPTLGSMPGIKAFTAAVIGGIGSIPGAMVGGLLLGIIECICGAVPALSKYTIAVEFVLLIVILLVNQTVFSARKNGRKCDMENAAKTYFKNIKKNFEWKGCINYVVVAAFAIFFSVLHSTGNLERSIPFSSRKNHV